MTRTRIAVGALLAVLLIAAGLSVQSLLAVAKGPETPSSYLAGQAIAAAKAAGRDPIKPPSFGAQTRSRLKAAGVTITAPRVAHTDYGSGQWGGPVGTVKRTGNPATADFLIIGDSVPTRCNSDLVAYFTAKGRTLASITQSGQNTAGVTALLYAEPVVPHYVIVASGYNDVFNPFALPSAYAQLRQWATAAGVELIFVDIRVARPTAPGRTMEADLTNSSLVNSYIHDNAPTAAPVIGWNAALVAARGRGRPYNYYIQDGTHPWADAGTAPYNHGDGCAAYGVTVANGAAVAAKR